MPRCNSDVCKLSFEREVQLRRFLALYRDLLNHFAILLLPCGDGIGSRWQSFDLERAVFGTHREERMGKYRDVRLHPGMNIALHRHRRPLRLIEALFLQVAAGLRFVPLAIDLRQRMDIVRSLIAVADIHFLPGDNAQYMRLVQTAVLVQLLYWIDRFESLVTQSVLDVDHDVTQ